eukprot:scaffold79351_cov46-Attheya_sp.AAC.2
MAIAIHPHSDPRNHLTRLYLVYLLVHVLKVFDGLVTDLLVENTMKVAWLSLGARYGLSWGYDGSKLLLHNKMHYLPPLQPPII